MHLKCNCVGRKSKAEISNTEKQISFYTEQFFHEFLSITQFKTYRNICFPNIRYAYTEIYMEPKYCQFS